MGMRSLVGKVFLGLFLGELATGSPVYRRFLTGAFDTRDAPKTLPTRDCIPMEDKVRSSQVLETQ